jgi:ABC-type uncharacterized transport system substrate-binding protein
MSRKDRLPIGRVGLALLAAALTLSGCALPTFRPDAAPEPQPEITVEPPLQGVSVKPLARTPLPPPRLPQVAIVLTNSQPAYADVAMELTRHFARHEIYDLDRSARPPVSILRSINDSNSDAVIAIGLRAAQSAVAMSQKPVVFTQVFNYEAHGLLSEKSRGVSALAPLKAQLAAWKGIDPTIARVGLIVGEGHDRLIADARAAAERHGIELHVQVSGSDQETLYFFRRMIRNIDGFWLFPDNRVLSARALQEMLGEARRHQVPVNVPSESMLQLGAMVSMSTVASNIATTIVAIVRQIQAGGLARIPPITQLSELRVVTNDTTQVVER